MRIFRSERKAIEAEDKLSTRVGEVERQLRMMQLEWSDTLDMLKRRMHRAIKERERYEAAEAEETAEVPAPETPQLDPVSARILARRHRISGGTQ